MEVRACKNCRRLFRYICGPELCPECRNLVIEEGEQMNTESTMPVKTMVLDEEDKFGRVRDYVMTHPKATIMQISEANEIPPTKLFEWIRDERLEFSDDSEFAWFECESCGAKIKSGRFCNRCNNDQQKPKSKNVKHIVKKKRA